MKTMLNMVELPTQVRMPYVEQGDPWGTPVVLLHGYPDSWFSFTPLLPHLPESIRAIVPTQRGWGDAGRPAEGYTMDDYAGDVLALLDALRIEAAVIAGHSMGSLIAQRFAIRHPERTLGLVLIGSVTTFAGHAGLLEFQQAIEALDGPLDPDLVREFQESMFVQPPEPELLEGLIAESMKAPLPVWKQSLAGILAFDTRLELSRISAPTRIIWGDQDQLCSRAEQDALLAGISNARLSVYRGGGHCVNWEQPAAVAAEIVDLAARVSDPVGC
ncbi:MAG TPA: alpha/beta hydrolase [Thermomicrobiales bacterium]|nr:alpha/beta hydrolase [Thermomicrobiales bacterium]